MIKLIIADSHIHSEEEDAVSHYVGVLQIADNEMLDVLYRGITKKVSSEVVASSDPA